MITALRYLGREAVECVKSMSELKAAVNQHGVIDLHLRVEWKCVPDNVTALHPRVKRLNLKQTLYRASHVVITCTRGVRAVQTHVWWAVNVQRHDVGLKHKLQPRLHNRQAKLAQLLRHSQNARYVRIKVKIDDVDCRLGEPHIEMTCLNNMHCWFEK